MSNEMTVWNWFFGILAGLWLLVVISFWTYAKVKRQKVERLPLFLILQIGNAGCVIAIMNLRDKHEGLAIALTIVWVILLATTGPMTWKRFVKHLRKEGLIAEKRAD